MDKRIKDLVEITKEKCDLTQYYLRRWDIVRSTTIFNDTVYRLSMEWFPNHINKWEDEASNPEGTASIEIDIQSKLIKRVILVGGKSYADNMRFDLNSKEEIIKWIEKETGLKYGEQFESWKEEEGELTLKECIDCISVSPSGYIQFKLDEAGKLILFSVSGQFPAKKNVKQEAYTLSFAQVKELVMEQLKLVEFPVMEQKELVSVFAMEEIYIKNDGSSTLPYEFFADNKSRLQMNRVIEWEHQIQRPFHREEITCVENVVTPEQAFQCEPHPDLQPITDEEIKKCLNAIQKFLNQEYVDDSGKWVLKTLYRNNGYIQAVLKINEQKERVFKRKMMLFINPKTYGVLNYMDNKSFLEMYMELKEPEEIRITKEEAFEKLTELIELKPCYVYDSEQGYYVLCGKLDCNYAVNACNGAIVSLNEL